MVTFPFQASFVTWMMPVSVILAMKMPFVTPTQWMAVPSAPAHQVLLVEPVIKMWMNAPLVRILFFLYGGVQKGMDAWNYASSKQWEGPKVFWDRLTSAGMPLNCFVSSCLYKYNFGPVANHFHLLFCYLQELIHVNILANVWTHKALSSASVDVVIQVHAVRQTSMNASPCLARMMPPALIVLENLHASACQVRSLNLALKLLKFILRL